MRRAGLPLALITVLAAAACGSAGLSPGSSPVTSAAPATAPATSGAPTSGAPVPSASPAPTGSPVAAPSGSVPDSAIVEVPSGAILLEPDSPAAPDAGVDTPCEAEGEARSFEGGPAATFRIANTTQSHYSLQWLDGQGQRVAWADLPPGASTSQDTLESYAWLVAKADGSCLAIFHAPADLAIRPAQVPPTSGPLFPTAAPSHAPVAGPTTPEAARAALLAATDVPAGASSAGISTLETGGGAFDTNGGLRGLSQEWTATGSISTVFDARWQFETAAGARAWLATAEDQLSERQYGLERDDSLETAGEHGSVWVGRFTISGADQAFYNFLFSQGNFVTKVFVAGAGDLDPASAVDIAKAAAGRTAIASGSGETPGAFPNAPEAELLAHVPAPIRASCQRDPSTPELATASVVCQLRSSAAAAVKYLQVRSTEDLRDLYAERERAKGGQSTGATCAEGPAKGPWSINGVDHGSLLCYEQDGNAWIEWTDERLDIYSLATRSGTAWAELFEWWASEAGPEA